MTKEVEVGDEFPTAKVVKTTTFGAFVELAKGTDGLLHISNVSPGQRVATVEEVLNKGDEIAVRVVEVDKERGRIGLRLAEDPEIAGKTGRGARDRRRRRRRRRRRPRRPRAAPRRPRPAPRGPRRRRRARPRPAPARRPRPRARVSTLPEHRLTTLDSGLRVVTEHMSSVRSAALGFFVGAGSRGERSEEAGLSHFLEHMLFRGTDRYASAEIDQLFDGMGAELNAGTDKEGTTVYARMLDQHLPRAFDVMADMVWRPGVQRRRPRARGRARGDRDVRGRPAGHGLRRARRRRLRRPPAGPPDHRPRAGDPRHAGRPTSPRSTRAATCPASVVVAAAGSVDHDQVVALAERTLAGLRAGERAPGARRRAGAARPRASASSAKETEQVHVCLGGPGLPRHDERRYAVRVLDAIFGGLSSSRLFQSVREERGLAYAVYSFAGQFTDTGQIGLYVGTRPDNLAEAMDVVGAELDAACASSPATEEELARARENVKARVVLALESSAARMNRLGGSTLYGLPLLETDEVMAQDRRGHARRPARARGRAVGARAALRRRHRAVAGGVLRRRGAGLPGRRARRRGMIRVAVAGAAGRMGQAVCAAVDGADDLELAGRADPALGAPLDATCSTAATSSSTSRGPTRRSTTRARCSPPAGTSWSARRASTSRRCGAAAEARDGERVRRAQLRDRRGADDALRRRGLAAHAARRDHRVPPSRPSSTRRRAPRSARPS